MTEDQRALLDECTNRPTCVARSHLSGCPAGGGAQPGAAAGADLLADLLAALGRAREDRRSTSTVPVQAAVDAEPGDGEDDSEGAVDVEDGVGVGGDVVGHGGLSGGRGDVVAAEHTTPTGLRSRPPESAERQRWRRVDTAGVKRGLVVEVDADGRARVHEAVLAQLLVDAGWERTA